MTSRGRFRRVVGWPTWSGESEEEDGEGGLVIGSTARIVEADALGEERFVEEAGSGRPWRGRWGMASVESFFKASIVHLQL